MNRLVMFCTKIGFILLVLAVIFISVASAATTTYNYSSGATTDKWAWEVDSNDDPPASVNSETVLNTDQYVSIGTLDGNRWQTLDPGSQDYISMKSTINIQESAASITNILFHVVAYKSGAQPKTVEIYGYNQTTPAWDLIGSGTVQPSPDSIVEASLTADFNHYIEADGNMTWCFLLARVDRWLYVNYVKVNVTHTTISGVATDKLTYKNGETITTTWTSADGFGSGEDCINVEYWDVTNGTRFDLKSHATSASSSTSKALTDSEGGHTIAVYVYTTSSETGNNSTAITHGDPWPYSIPNAVQSWQSYAEVGHTTVWGTADHKYDSTNHTVYMHGEGFQVSHQYKIAYYDVSDSKVQTETNTSDGTGALSSQYDFTGNASATAGLWHSAVYDATDSPPSTYNSTDPNNIVDDDFTVEQSAIPEFPTVIAAIAVCMLCAVAYVVMRRNKYGKK